VRTHTHTLTTTPVIRYKLMELVPLEKNISEKISLIMIILPYSAIKIKANPNLPYSMLNPDTSSDSPSAKSKGVRLVSARHDTNQIPTSGIKISLLYQKVFINDKYIKLIVELKTK